MAVKMREQKRSAARSERVGCRAREAARKSRIDSVQRRRRWSERGHGGLRKEYVPRATRARFDVEVT